MNTVSFELNDKLVTAEYEPKTTLLKYLRNEECLKGTKEACSTGHCGACTVIIDGKAKRSCIVLLKSLEGARVLTIEGLSREGVLHPVQKALLDVGAVQCGYCTPGMVMAIKALLDQHKQPTSDQINEALKYNYCRCTGYVKIIEAIYLAAKRMYEDPEAEPDYFMEKTEIVMGTSGADIKVPSGKSMGQSLWDMEGLAKVQGTLEFTGDYEFEGMLQAATVWAEIPCGRILDIDTAEAAAMPGVVRLFTYKDVPGQNAIGQIIPDQPVFCEDKVSFIGDAVAMVVAETEDQARDAAKKVKVSYEKLPGIYTMEDAVKNESMFKTIFYETGNVDEAKKAEDVEVVKINYDIPRQEHACMETEAAVALCEDKGITVYCTTQSPYELQRMLARVLNLSPERIRIIAPPLGGAFGKKCDPYMEPMVAVAVWILKRPVRLVLNRRESLLRTTKRHSYKIDYEIGVSKDGLIQYVDANFLMDGGPYMNLSPGVLEQSMIFSCGPYRIPSGRVLGKALKTNNVLGGAFRGFGINQAAVAIEVALDVACERLGLNPFEVRLKNGVKSGDVTFTGQHVEYSVGILDTVRLCKESLEKALKGYEGKYPNGSKVLGWGMASGYKNVGVGKGVTDDGGAIITLREDGSWELRASGIDMGQGFRTAMLQLCAEALDVEPDKITVISGDTGRTLRHGQAVSERQTLCSGRAVVEACEAIKRKLAEKPWKPGETYSAEYAFIAPKTYALHDNEGRKAAGDQYRNYPSYAYTTQGVIVEVDKKTGEVKVLKVVACHDVGRAINPHIIEGQIHGSCSMGIGWALTERLSSSEGIPLQKHYKDLGMPRIDETPLYDLILVENPEPIGPYGAKGISEVATVPMTPAVMNAVSNALGSRFISIPITKEKVLAAVKDQERR